MIRRCLALLALLASVGARGAVVEEVVQVPVEAIDAGGNPHRQAITVTVLRDDSRAKSPFLVLNHGRPGTAEGRRKLGRARYSANAKWFVERGFAVFVPTRVGYGVTGGPDLENTGPCGRRDYPRGFEAAAAQTMAVIRHAKDRGYVDAQRGVLVGQSFGGAATVALAAKDIDGVIGAINIAGGSGGDPVKHPADPCSPGALAQTLAGYGASARTPMLWLYSENDRYWGRELPRDWYAAFNANGGNARFVQLPPSGEDGHSVFTANSAAWRPHVERFLEALATPEKCGAP
jgi:dienelactone hydrolase